MRRLLIVVLCASLLSGGCATSRAVAPPAMAAPDRTASIVEYVQKLPVGSRIRIDLVGGGTVRGTLMRATEHFVEVQPSTRLPEPPQRVPIDRVLRVEPETRNNVGRAIAIGVAAGAAGAVGVLLILAAIFADD